MNCGRVLSLLVIAAVVVCVAGVLILPQVDLPAFVLNGAKVPTAAAAHVHAAPTSGISYLEVLRPTLGSSRFNLNPMVRDADEWSAPDTSLPLRC